MQCIQEDIFGSFGPKPVDVKLLSGFGFVEYDSIPVSANVCMTVVNRI